MKQQRNRKAFCRSGTVLAGRRKARHTAGLIVILIVQCAPAVFRQRLPTEQDLLEAAKGHGPLVACEHGAHICVLKMEQHVQKPCVFARDLTCTLKIDPRRLADDQGIKAGKGALGQLVYIGFPVRADHDILLRGMI